MTKLPEYTSYADAQQYCTPDKLWELCDGDRGASEHCVRMRRRHASRTRRGILAHADGRDELLTFQQIAANQRNLPTILQRGNKARDRVAVMLEPSRAFLSRFRSDQYGAIAVPLFTLFGPTVSVAGQDCAPRC